MLEHKRQRSNGTLAAAAAAEAAADNNHISISIQKPTTESASAAAAAAVGEAAEAAVAAEKRQQQKQNSDSKEAIILGHDFSNRSSKFLFLFGTGGVLICYTMYGYVLEYIFRTDGVRPYGAYITFVQFILYTLFAFFEQSVVARGLPDAVPWRTYSLIGLLTVTTMVCSNSALGYLSYPTQVILKCCKLIPTMIGGILIQGKRYNIYDVTAMFAMIFGCIWFTLANVTVQPNFHLFGIFLMSFALCADGAIGNVQEKTMKAFNHSATEVILYTYIVGVVYIGAGLIVFGMLSSSVQFSFTHPTRIYGSLIILSMCGYLGLQFVLILVRSYGALPAVTVTTCRKVITIILSFIMFAKPFTIQYIWASLLVIAGIYLNLYSKNKAKWDNAASDFYRTMRFKLKAPTAAEPATM